MVDTGYEPRFDIDYAYGRQGELLLVEILEKLAAGQGQVEVKRKRILDFELYVEHEHDPGRRGTYVPSGIAVTQAEYWAYNFDDSGIYVLMPLPLLRAALEHKSVQDKAENDGSCPTHGKLVNLAAVLRVAFGAYK